MLWKTPKYIFFVFLKVKIFNRAERYTLFALYGSVGFLLFAWITILFLSQISDN